MYAKKQLFAKILWNLINKLNAAIYQRLTAKYVFLKVLIKQNF